MVPNLWINIADVNSELQISANSGCGRLLSARILTPTNHHSVSQTNKLQWNGFGHPYNWSGGGFDHPYLAIRGGRTTSKGLRSGSHDSSLI